MYTEANVKFVRRTQPTKFKRIKYSNTHHYRERKTHVHTVKQSIM
jgi:hypothetical protein